MTTIQEVSTTTMTPATEATAQPMAQATVPPSRPSATANFYETFLLKNVDQITSIENAINSLSYILPGRFKDVEVASEGLCSALHILSLYHDSILIKTTAKLAQSDPTIKPSLHNKYTSFFFSSSSSGGNNNKYKPVVMLLTLIQSTQLLAEMVAKKPNLNTRFTKGRVTRWRVILILELLKALCRLMMFKSTQYRPIMGSPIPEREIDPAQLSYDQNGKLILSQDTEDLDGESTGGDYKMPRTGLRVPREPIVDARKYLATRVLGADDVNAPKDLVRPLRSNQAKLAEVIYILRPLVYAGLVYRSKQTKSKSRLTQWAPWVVGITMDYVSRQTILRSYGKPSTLEAEILAQRMRSMAWWSLRGPAYESLLRPFVAAVIGKTQNIPGINFFTAIVDDYLYLLDNYHFASSTL